MNSDKRIENVTIFFCWSVAAIATMGSLFFSEVMKFQPCVLCWYQRIAMYPLIVLFAIGFFQTAKSTIYFTLPIAVIGWVTALYHNLLHYEIIPESASPCQMGVSCSTVYINWFGIITIPMLSLIAFTMITIALVFLNRSVTNEK
ncbi:MAG: disulfide bond formation protein B [Halobacteriovoraceae bacterium]|nr:disulfide bond formation protein B [Halobacteriovoraceae bacterium]